MSRASARAQDTTTSSMCVCWMGRRATARGVSDVERALSLAWTEARRTPLLVHLTGAAGELQLGLGRPFSVLLFSPRAAPDQLLYALGVVVGAHQGVLQGFSFADVDSEVFFDPGCAVLPETALDAAVRYAADGSALPAGPCWRTQASEESIVRCRRPRAQSETLRARLAHVVFRTALTRATRPHAARRRRTGDHVAPDRLQPWPRVGGAHPSRAPGG
jgi:hypothetical protein